MNFYKNLPKTINNLTKISSTNNFPNTKKNSKQVVLLIDTYNVCTSCICCIKIVLSDWLKDNSIKTSILKVLLKQYKPPTGPNKFSRGITPTNTSPLPAPTNFQGA